MRPSDHSSSTLPVDDFSSSTTTDFGLHPVSR
jgi:hypothetical protein